MEVERAHDDMGDNNTNENTNNKCVNKATAAAAADEAKAAWQLQLQLHFHLLVEGIGSSPGMRLHADCVSVCVCAAVWQLPQSQPNTTRTAARQAGKKGEEGEERRGC